MDNGFQAPVGARWKRRGIAACAGITLAGFLVGGAFAWAAAGGTAAPAARTAPAGAPAATSASNGDLNALLNASRASGASDSTAGTSGKRVGALRRLRQIGGYYGSLTFHAKTGVRTLAFERGTIEAVSQSDMVVRAPDGTTMTWQIVSDTVVRQKGAKAATSALADGQLVFVGGPVVSGARDARLIAIRPPTGTATPTHPATS
jgi:hypothetical protein